MSPRVHARLQHRPRFFWVNWEDLLLQILPELLGGDRQDHAQQKNDLLTDYSKHTHTHIDKQDK